MTGVMISGGFALQIVFPGAAGVSRTVDQAAVHVAEGGETELSHDDRAASVH